MHSVGDVDLDADADNDNFKVNFQVGANNLQNSICDQYIVINYQIEDGQSKTMIIPFQLVNEKGKLAQFWDKHSWKVITGGAIIVTATLVIYNIHQNNVRFVNNNYELNNVGRWMHSRNNDGFRRGQFAPAKLITYLLDWKNLVPLLNTLSQLRAQFRL